MRKLLSAALALILALSLGTGALADNYNYVVEDGELVGTYDGPGGDIVVPDDVDEVPSKYFMDNDSITSVTIPETVSFVGAWAFQNCTNLETAYLYGPTTIGIHAFLNCTGLKTVYIGKNVEHIPYSVFNNCPNITDVYYEGSALDWIRLDIDPDRNGDLLDATIHFGEDIAIPTVSTAQEAADFLYELGLFQGTAENADGTPVFELERTPTRFEAITMLVRLLGAEDEALSGSWSTPFTDLAEWAAPYVGYAYAKGLTDGTSETTYGGGDSVNATQFLTFVLRALGYESGEDFQWDAAWQLTDALEITDGQFGAGSGFTRGDVAFTSVRALGTELKAGGETLLESISGKLTLPERPAEEPETPEEPEEETPSEPDYASYARRTFARVKASYSNATPNFARYQVYTNADGDRCVLVVVSYTIISNYTQTDLYNLDTGAVITNPTSYYQQLANRSYGANKIYYMDLYGEVLQQYMAALRSGVQVGPELLVA